MKHRLAQPVEFGETRLAPTVELAGLAELAGLDDEDDRIAALTRIAEAVRADDLARAELAAHRSQDLTAIPLPRRGG